MRPPRDAEPDFSFPAAGCHLIAEFAGFNALSPSRPWNTFHVKQRSVDAEVWDRRMVDPTSFSRVKEASIGRAPVQFQSSSSYHSGPIGSSH